MSLVREITETVRMLVENDILDNFDNEAFDGVAWQARKREDRQAGRRALLVKSGRMKRGLEVQIEGNNVAVYSDTEYATYHNEGTDKMPQRQFVGISKELEQQIDKEIDSILDKFFD